MQNPVKKRGRGSEVNGKREVCAFEAKLQSGGLGDLSRTARYLVAVSGGRDSVALLHGLVRLGFKRLIVCHLDHGLRGGASGGDARFAAALAKKLGLEFEGAKADVRKLAEEYGHSIEATARDARYRFFARVAKERRCRSVFVAHHADDQVETVLFNLFRGSGRAGLGGMSGDSIRVVDQTKIHLLRPMLGIWRSEIDGYVAACGLRYRDDASNGTLVPTRNKIRHELIPMVEKLFGREVRAAVWRNAEILRAEEEWLVKLVEAGGEADSKTKKIRAGAESHAGKKSVESELSVPGLRSQPVALQRRRIMAWLREHDVPLVGYESVETVRSLLNGTTAKVNLPGNWHARRREKKLFLERGGKASG